VKPIGALLILVLFLSLGGCWEVYRWNDCRSVGHSTFYCIMTINK